MLNLQNKTIVFCLPLFFCFFFSPLAFGQGKTEWLNDKVTLRFQEEPMSSVLGKLSQQTGIAILYDEKLAGQKVTGLYKDIKFAEAINRLFSETNKSIQVLKNEKKIIVKTFGAKNFVLALSAQRVPSPANKTLDNSEKMTLADLEKMHRQQYKEYKERIANPNEILEGGMTRGELTAMHKKQNAEYKKRIANNNEVLEGGMTRGELTAMHKKQNAEYKKRIANDNEVLEGGMTRGELTAMHKKQNAEYKKRIANDNEVLEDGMTRGQLKVMHKQQNEEYKKRITNKNNIIYN
ncbi:MAG: hypothetical protein D3911_12675 [Candidatus Electrothrix sp. AW3_4]|nr:hypothetical protein [Candidatus Electrothrix gigas]